MNQISKNRFFNYAIVLIAAFAILPFTAEAQRLPRSGGRPAAKPAASRPAPSSRPAPATKPAPATRPAPATKPSINGGAKVSPDRQYNPPAGAQGKAADARSSIQSNPGAAKEKAQNVDRAEAQAKVQDSNIGNKTNIGNKVDIDTGDKNVNINVDNSKDININNSRNNYYRPSPRPYYRPPYSYGGFHFYCHFGYHYHPYTPFYWGPTWHPWGFFLATLTATAIVVSVNNQQYHYDQGVFYEPSNGGYTAVQAPNGAVVPEIPPGAEEVKIEQTVTNNYYYGGTYYEKGAEGYTVVPPTAGSLVTNLPEGAEEMKVGDVTYVKYGDTLYQPVQVEGKDMYEVAQVEKAEE